MNQIEDMQTFVRVVEAGSITKAADQLNTVKSAVSRRLAQLEKRLEVSLITRTTRTQSLTESGQSYYQQCLRILDDIAEVEANISNEDQALAGKIKIAAPLSFGLSHLSQALRKFSEIHPDIYFDVDFNDRKIDLIEEGFDLAVRIAALEDSTLIAKRLFVSKAVLCASPGYLKIIGTPLVPQDLTKGHVKLHYRDSKNEWPFKLDNNKQITIKVPTKLTANNGNFLTQLAVDGQGLIYTPDFICYKEIKLGQLTPLLSKYLTGNEITGYAIYPQKRHLSKRVRSLVDYLAIYFGEAPYWRLENETNN